MKSPPSDLHQPLNFTKYPPRKELAPPHLPHGGLGLTPLNQQETT